MGWLKNFIRKHIVGDLPDEMNRCGYCNNVKCSNGHFDTSRTGSRAQNPKTTPPKPDP